MGEREGDERWGHKATNAKTNHQPTCMELAWTDGIMESGTCRGQVEEGGEGEDEDEDGETEVQVRQGSSEGGLGAAGTLKHQSDINRVGMFRQNDFEAKRGQ